jgi:hypothetical protein
MTSLPAKPAKSTPLAPTPSYAAPRPEPGGPAPLPGPVGPNFPAGRTSPAPPVASGRELAQPYAALALARMAEMIGDPDPKVALPACREIIDRAWGKAEASSRSVGEEAVVVVVQTRESEDA